jgi:hypothetical protein
MAPPSRSTRGLAGAFPALNAARLLLALSAWAGIGCGLAEGPREKLQHTAFAFNEGLRWGRDGDVLPHVDPAALDGFRALHNGWGAEIQVSSVDILQSTIDDKLDKAVITVKYTWYRADEMLVHDTVTAQHWERRKGEWWMTVEEYRSGTPL